MKTDRPNTTAEISSDRFPGQITGIADPMAIPLRIIAKGRPEAWRAKSGRHTIGEMQMLRPIITQTKAMNPELAAWAVIQADRKVR
jgi:hypothetical protein